MGRGDDSISCRKGSSVRAATPSFDISNNGVVSKSSSITHNSSSNSHAAATLSCISDSTLDISPVVSIIICCHRRPRYCLELQQATRQEHSATVHCSSMHIH
mmetsp:Transcript_29988/g.45377  ORF Transcript_29988/g.45377 Transcript_29988/m.45377 type:complete len:102 (-) Transcript_29988:91-396(-)